MASSRFRRVAALAFLCVPTALLASPGPCSTNNTLNAGLYFSGGMSVLASPPVYPWRPHFTLMSRYDSSSREITGFDPNYSPGYGEDPGHVHPDDPDGFAQGAWSENRYTAFPWAWTPTASQVGTWQVAVWVKSTGSTSTYDVVAGTGSFSITN